MEASSTLKDLQAAASVASFESTDRVTFRANLAKCLHAVVATHSTTTGGGWNHYSSSSQQLEHVFDTHIPWRELLSHHEPMQEIVALMLNPRLVPYAASPAVAMVFVRVLLLRDSSTTTPASQHVLFQALKALLSQRPSAQKSIGARLVEYIEEHQRLTLTTFKSYPMNQAHRLVSVMKHLAGVLDGTVILKCLLLVLQSIDDVDVELLSCSKRQERMATTCSCQGGRATTRKRPRGLSKQLSLDDDYERHDDDSGLTIQTVAVMGGATIERISRVVNVSSTHTTFDACRNAHSSRNITQLPLPLVLLRSRLYRKIVNIFDSLGMKQTCTGTGEEMLLQSVVHMACRYPDSASLRTCVVLLMDTCGKKGYQCVISYLWRSLERRKSTFGEAVLRIHTEILAECSYFDSPKTLWEALCPLVEHVSDLVSSQLSSCSNERDMAQIRHALRCLSFLLCRRRSVLTAMESNDDKWQSFVSKLSLAFGEDQKWWISDDMSRDEREETLCTLQAFGILGFLDSQHDRHDIPLKEQQPTFPFPELSGIRCALRRMGPNVARDGLLSNHSSTARQTLSPLQNKPAQTSDDDDDDRLIGSPIMDYLNSDVLKIVFSFLGYKRLVKASGICKAWNTLVDDDALWRQAYVARFHIIHREETVILHRIKNWKTLLMNKVMVEKTLRFKRHSSGWKHRTCSHLGCLVVLKSPRQMKKHYGTHRPKAQRTKKPSKRKMTKTSTSCPPSKRKRNAEKHSKAVALITAS